MANECYFEMNVAGYRDNVDAFISILEESNYDNIHLARIFESYVYDVVDVGLWRKASIWGYCAWSVYSCMINGLYSYYHSDLNYHIQQLLDHKETKFTTTNLIELSDKLKLTIEVYSQEPGIGFYELYKILPGGKLIVNHEGKYQEVYIGDCETYEELKDWYYNSDPPIDEGEFKQLKQDGVENHVITDYEYTCTIPDEPKYLFGKELFKYKNKQ